MERDNGGRTEGLTGFGRGGGRGKLGGCIISGDADFELSRTRGDKDFEKGGETELRLPGISVGKSSSYSSTEIPTFTDVITSLHTWGWLHQLCVRYNVA